MRIIALLFTLTATTGLCSTDSDVDHQASSQTLLAQRQALATNTQGHGYGPQSPRNIDSLNGNNRARFTAAPAYTFMNLCNIHFHKNAEHAGGEFNVYAGFGDGQGNDSGYLYSGNLTQAEREPVLTEVCPSSRAALQSGDTIEVHYVHSTAQVGPGPTLGACSSEATANPQLRVEAQVLVLVNDPSAENFLELTRLGKFNGFHQAVNLPITTGLPVQYFGSTTGPAYNEIGSPFQVTWGVRPKVAKVNIHSVAEWCQSNVFAEDHAHGVRNLVVNLDLLAPVAP